MIWINADIQEFIYEADKFEAIKNYSLKITFPKNYKRIEELITLIKKEYNFLKIDRKENVLILINPMAKKELENILTEEEKEDLIVKEHPFVEIINILIEEEEKIFKKYLKELKKNNKDEEIIFQNYVYSEIEEWQIEYIKILKKVLKKYKIKNKNIENKINNFQKEEKPNTIKYSKKETKQKRKYKRDSNGLIILKK